MLFPVFKIFLLIKYVHTGINVILPEMFSSHCAVYLLGQIQIDTNAVFPHLGVN